MFLYILTLLILTTIEIKSEKSIDNLFLITHSNSPSHLSVIFDVAERLNDSKNIYDIRWPIVESVVNYPTRNGFKTKLFLDSLTKAKKIQDIIDEMSMKKSGSNWALIEVLFEVFDSLFLPCSTMKKINIQQGTKNVVLMDPCTMQCILPMIRKSNPIMIYVSPLVESSLLSYYSGSSLPGNAMSNMKADPNPYFHVRVANVFSHGFFRLFLYQLAAARWYYNLQDYNTFKDLEPSLVLINTHKFIEHPLPRTNLAVDIGNTNPKPFKKLSSEIENFMKKYDSIIIFSMSTFANDGSLPENLIKELLSSFNKFDKIGFIFRLKKSLVEVHPTNVLFQEYIDQQSMLQHEKTRILITHCGMNSVMEAFRYGIPVIGIPTMGDQFPNAERIKKAGTGIILDLHSLNEYQITASINRIVRINSIESKRAKKMAEMLKHERDEGISVDGTLDIKKFVAKNDKSVQYLIPKITGWIIHFYLDWLTLFIIIFTIFAF